MAVKAEDMRSLQDTADKNRYNIASDEGVNCEIATTSNAAFQQSLAVS